MSVELLPLIEQRPNYLYSFLYLLFIILLIILTTLSVSVIVKKLWFYIKREVFIRNLKIKLQKKGIISYLQGLIIYLFHITARNINDTPFAYPSKEWIEAVTHNLPEKQPDRIKQLLLEIILKPISICETMKDKELIEAELLVIKLIRKWYV